MSAFGQLPPAFFVDVRMLLVEPGFAFLATTAKRNIWFIIWVAALSNDLVVLPIVPRPVVFAGEAGAFIWCFGSRVSPWKWSASCLSFSDRADVDRKVSLRELGKETLVVVLVGKVGVSAIVTWLRVAADLQRGEIVTTVVVVVFNC
jgi:hypothetical protein